MNLAFKGELDMRKVSDRMEMGKQIRSGEYSDPCFVGSTGVQRILDAWMSDVLDLMRKKEPKDSEVVENAFRMLVDDNYELKEYNEEEFDALQEYFKEQEKWYRTQAFILEGMLAG